MNKNAGSRSTTTQAAAWPVFRRLLAELPLSLQHVRLDALRDPLGRLLRRIGREVRVARRRLHLAVAQELPDHGQRLGVRASELAHEGTWGVMAALQGRDINPVPLEDVLGKVNTLREDFFDSAELFFG